MSEPLMDLLKRCLETQLSSDQLIPLPKDLYARVAAYTTNLRRTLSSSNSEVANRLTTKQSAVIRGMVKLLVKARTGKAVSAGILSQLLPEERYICEPAALAQLRFESFVEALSSGQQSFLELAQRYELNKNVTVRILKPLTEVVGLDLRRYGPFEPNDIASIPQANADILIANGGAVLINTRDDG